MMDAFEIYVARFLIKRLFSARKIEALKQLSEEALNAATALNLLVNL